MPVDLSVFGRQKSIVDQQQLQDAFNAKKQAQQLQALGTVAALQQQISPQLSPKDLINYQMQMQNHEDTVGLRKQQMESTDAYRAATLDAKKDTIQTKADQKKLVDQNLLSNALGANQEQINKINELFDPEGNLKEDVAANYGTTMGMQLPVVFQSTADARAKLNNVNANSFIRALGDMKSQSATGASGLGALSVKEGDKVQSAASAAADTRQSPESAKVNFLAYKKSLEDSNARLQNGFYNVYGAQQGNVGLPSTGAAPITLTNTTSAAPAMIEDANGNRLQLINGAWQPVK